MPRLRRGQVRSFFGFHGMLKLCFWQVLFVVKWILRELHRGPVLASSRLNSMPHLQHGHVRCVVGHLGMHKLRRGHVLSFAK